MNISSAVTGVRPEAYGALGDGVTDDTTAFVNAIAAANKLQPLVLMPGRTYIVSNLTFQGSASGPAEEVAQWGIIGNGATIKGKAAATGTMLLFGAATDTAVGYRNLIVRDLRVVGHATYTNGIQFGNVNAGNAVIVLGEVRNVVVRDCTGASAIGILIRSAVQLDLQDVYGANCTTGLQVGTTAGAGIVTTLSLRHCKFRLCTTGAAFFTGTGIRFWNNVYESNTSTGLRLRYLSTAPTPIGDIVAIGDWFEANTTYGLLCDSDGTGAGGVTPGRWINAAFNGGTSGALRVEDGDRLIFDSCHFVGAGAINLPSVNLRVFIINRFGSGTTTGAGVATSLTELTTGFLSGGSNTRGLRLVGPVVLTNGENIRSYKADGTTETSLVLVTANDLAKFGVAGTTIADNGTLTIGAVGGLNGLLVVFDRNVGTRHALYLLHGNNATATEVSDPSGLFTPTLGNAGTINIGASAGNYVVENKSGGSIGIQVALVGN
mgnify:CR=1 FL=1